MVALFHFNQSNIPVHNWYRNVINFGWLGVPVFFVISGYYIAVSATNCKTARDFAVKRFFRIFPAYWISLIIVLIAAFFQKFFLGVNSVHNIPRDFYSIIFTLTLATDPLSNTPTCNWVYWSLTCELLFYILVYLLLVATKKKLQVPLLIFSIFALFIPFQNTGLFFFIDHWPAFGIGVSIFYFSDQSKYARPLSILMIFINLSALVIKFQHQMPYILVTVIGGILILSSNYFTLKKTVISTYGRYSYSIYLMHVPVGVFILELFQLTLIQVNPYLNLIYDLVILGFIIMFSSIIFSRIEQPFIRLSKKLTEGKNFET